MSYLIWAWLAIWLSWLWACIGEWWIWAAAMEAIWERPELSSKIMVFTILFIALVESAAIYWLIVSLNITSH